eukprot:70962-Amphidinium_carterae.1
MTQNAWKVARGRPVVQPLRRCTDTRTWGITSAPTILMLGSCKEDGKGCNHSLAWSTGQNS